VSIQSERSFLRFRVCWLVLFCRRWWCIFRWWCRPSSRLLCLFQNRWVFRCWGGCSLQIGLFFGRMDLLILRVRRKGCRIIGEVLPWLSFSLWVWIRFFFISFILLCWDYWKLGVSVTPWGVVSGCSTITFWEERFRFYRFAKPCCFLQVVSWRFPVIRPRVR
jgi:hypothetical protein